MNKVIFILFLLIQLCIYAQEIALDTSINAPKEFISYSTIDEVKIRTFPKDFQRKYQSEKFQYEPIVKQSSQWQQFKDWMTGLIRKLFNLQSKNAASEWFENLIRFLIFLIVAAVIFFIVKAIHNKEGKWIFGMTAKNKIANQLEIESNLKIVNFEELISHTLKSGEYRLVIRYYYLWVLKRLYEKNYIQWDINKTNSDYLYEIKDKTIKDRFSYNCYLYDYIWYGEFELTKEDYLNAEYNFKETLRLI